MLPILRPCPELIAYIHSLAYMNFVGQAEVYKASVAGVMADKFYQTKGKKI